MNDTSHEERGVGYNFRPVERDQQYLMPASLRDWLPEDDLAWVVLDAVDAIDLSAIRSRYRSDGWGAPAFDPALMTALLLYAYATGERSSRRIEARCRRDVAYRVICANQVPDHATIARFRADHEVALGALFGEILRLCAAAGLGRLGLVALDGTKLAADASPQRNRSADALDGEIRAILAEAAATDAAEDAEHGPDRRGDELPIGLADRRTRLARLVEARRQLAEAEAAHGRRPAAPPRDPGSDSAARPGPGRRPGPDGRARPGYWTERNTTDPDSRKMRGGSGWVQGYNGQIVASEDGVILAAALSQGSNDVHELPAMVAAVQGNVAAAGFRRPRIGTLLADAGYWSEANMAVERNGGPRLLIAPLTGGPRRPGSTRPELPGRVGMRRRLARPSTAAVYRRRAAIVEPVFGQTKEIRGARRFRRRGFGACASEWSLLCATHNLLKLWRSGWTGPHRAGPTVGSRSGRHRTPHRGSFHRC